MPPFSTTTAVPSIAGRTTRVQPYRLVVRVPDCRSGGCGFEPRRPRFKGPLTTVVSGSFLFFVTFQPSGVAGTIARRGDWRTRCKGLDDASRLARSSCRAVIGGTRSAASILCRVHSLPRPFSAASILYRVRPLSRPPAGSPSRPFRRFPATTERGPPKHQTADLIPFFQQALAGTFSRSPDSRFLGD